VIGDIIMAAARGDLSKKVSMKSGEMDPENHHFQENHQHHEGPATDVLLRSL
jgi:hypothetical protein